MKQKAILIIALLALVSMMIAPVMAESLTGTIGGDSVNSQSYSLTPNWAYPGYFSSITVNGSEYIPPAFILVRFDDGTIPNYASQGLPRAPSGNTTSVYICYSTEPCTQLNNRGHGTIGYQRNFDNAFPTSNEIDGFQWIDITDFNSTGVTGFNKFNLIFDFELNTVYVPTFISPESIPPAGISFGGSPGGSASGNYLLNTVLSFANDYSATKPAGIGIMGVLLKDSGACDPNCPSRGFVYNGATGALITSDSTINSVDLSFETTLETIIFGATDANMNHYNSSILFSVAVPTVTPTPTPTTTIPDSSQFLFLNGTRAITGNLNMGSNQITSLITGSTGDTAVNKTYVDTATTGMIHTLRTTSNQTINAGAATFVGITDLTFPVTNGNSYAFHYYIAFTSLNATFGWKAGVNAPTGDLDFWAQSDVIANGVAGVATHTERHNDARDDMTLLTSTVTANVPLAIRIDGRYLCTQDGTFAPRFANELASNSNINVLKGSYGWYF